MDITKEEWEKKASEEVRRYTDNPIIHTRTPIPKNHLFAVRDNGSCGCLSENPLYHLYRIFI